VERWPVTPWRLCDSAPRAKERTSAAKPRFDASVQPDGTALSQKLWLLWRQRRVRFDGFNGFVVRAPDEAVARRMADQFRSEPRQVWVDPALAGCKRLSEQGKTSVILASGELEEVPLD